RAPNESANGNGRAGAWVSSLSFTDIRMEPAFRSPRQRLPGLACSRYRPSNRRGSSRDVTNLARPAVRNAGCSGRAVSGNLDQLLGKIDREELAGCERDAVGREGETPGGELADESPWDGSRGPSGQAKRPVVHSCRK